MLYSLNPGDETSRNNLIIANNVPLWIKIIVIKRSNNCYSLRDRSIPSKYDDERCDDVNDNHQQKSGIIFFFFFPREWNELSLIKKNNGKDSIILKSINLNLVENCDKLNRLRQNKLIKSRLITRIPNFLPRIYQTRKSMYQD